MANLTDAQCFERLHDRLGFTRDLPPGPPDDALSFDRGSLAFCSLCCEPLADVAPGSVELRYPSTLVDVPTRVRWCRRCYVLWDRWRREPPQR